MIDRKTERSTRVHPWTTLTTWTCDTCIVQPGAGVRVKPDKGNSYLARVAEIRQMKDSGDVTLVVFGHGVARREKLHDVRPDQIVKREEVRSVKRDSRPESD